MNEHNYRFRMGEPRPRCRRDRQGYNGQQARFNFVDSVPDRQIQEDRNRLYKDSLASESPPIAAKRQHMGTLNFNKQLSSERQPVGSR